MRRMLPLFLLIFSSVIYSQIFTGKDVDVCKAKINYAVIKDLEEKPVNEVIAEIGKSFIGTDYEASALEKEGEEQLVINLTGLDCTTFLENALVLSRLVKKGDTTFEDYKRELTFIRYRDGEIDQYPSRLHYFSDWIFNNAEKGIVNDITMEIGGEPIRFDLSFMSTNPDKYMHLKNNPGFVKEIKKQEEEISSRDYFYIPKSRVKELETNIKEGDLIAITTSIKGLDIGHVGIAVRSTEGRIHYLHAPDVGSKVQITKEPLSDYLAKFKRHTGIMVLRAVEPPQKKLDNLKIN